MLSVIIPAYNEESMIEKTTFVINEILMSANISHELIFVNDGSKDGSLKICNEYANKYSNINADNIDKIIETEIGLVFSKVLEHAGVYKRDQKGLEAFLKFAENVK